jgi:molybdopterin-binding protein
MKRNDPLLKKEADMKYGARNAIKARVKSVKKGDIMSLVKFEAISAPEMASVLTTESVDNMGLKTGDTVELIIKAIHVLPVKE